MISSPRLLSLLSWASVSPSENNGTKLGYPYGCSGSSILGFSVEVIGLVSVAKQVVYDDSSFLQDDLGPLGIVGYLDMGVDTDSPRKTSLLYLLD